ncbi:hypothetical protein Tco_1209044 [Tanacetum coccineum]
MDPNSSPGKICLGENIIEILSDKVEGSGDWNSLEFQDTANSGQKKETKAMVFYQMDTEEVSDRFVAPCFVNGLEAYDGEINLGVEENMISNEYAVKLCLEHEVKRGNKVVKKELIVALRSEIYFVKFIINPEENDVEPGVIFSRSFQRMTKAITDFGAGTVTIYLDIDLFLKETKEEEMSNDDWDHLLDFNIDDIPLLSEEELPPFVCKIRKSNGNKNKSMENLSLFYQDIGTSSSAGGHLTQEKATKEALAIRISQKFSLLEEKDKLALDGKIVKEEEEAVKRIKGKALKEKEDTGAFIFPIRFKGLVNKNALADTGLDINNMPYRIYEQLWEHSMMRPDHHDPNTLDNMKLWKRYCFHKFTMSSCYGKDVTEMQSLEINAMLRIRLREAGTNEEIFTSVAWIRAFNINEPIYAELCHEFYSTYEFDKVCADDELQTKKIIKLRFGGRAHCLTLNPVLKVIHKMITYGLCQRTTGYDKIQKNDLWLLSMFDTRRQNGVLTEDVVRSLSALIYCRDLDTITHRDLIDSEGKLISEDPQPGVPRVGIPRPPRASMQDLYQGVFEHMARVYSVSLHGTYNPPGYAQPQYDQYYQQYPPLSQYPPQYQQQQVDVE